MKRMGMISVSVLVAGVMVMGVLAGRGSAADAPAATKTKSKPSVIVGGFSIARAKKDDKFHRSMGHGMQVGTIVSLYVSMPGKTIINLDPDACMLRKFTDDKGTVLAKPGSAKGFKPWLGGAVIASDPHSIAPSFHSVQLPAAGASSLTIDATLAFICGEAPKTAQCDVSLAKGTPVKLGMVAAKITKVGKPRFGHTMKFSVTFTSSQSLDSIRKLVFLDSSGKEIKSRKSRHGKSMFGTYYRTYHLEKKVDKVTIKIDYWGKLETVTVPVKLNVKIGL